jgi:signal transduction histidine kinase
VIDRATNRMSRLVEDLLATARRSASALVDTDVDLSAVAREAGEDG